MLSFSVQAESRSAEGESRPHSRAKNNEKETKLSVKMFRHGLELFHAHFSAESRRTKDFLESVKWVHKTIQGEVKQSFPSRRSNQ